MQQKTIYHLYKDSHQVDPSRPIFYIIQHIPSGKYYAGYKSNSKPFMIEGGYMTSSKIIKEIIKNEGLKVFQIVKIRYFETGDIAQKYEERFLRRIDAKNSLNFYNLTNGSGKFKCKGHTLESRNKMRGPRGPHSKEHSEKIGRAHLGMKRSHETRIRIGNAKRGKKFKHKVARSAEHCNKISQSKIGKTWSAELRERMKESQRGKKCLWKDGEKRLTKPNSDRWNELIAQGYAERV